MGGKQTLIASLFAVTIAAKARSEHMPVRRGKSWFAVKRFGYGVGLPIAWEGWLLLSVFVAAMTLSGLLLPPLVFAVLVIPLTAAVLYLAYVRSDGEWRYRNGE
jgi:hypothetical protein